MGSALGPRRRGRRRRRWPTDGIRSKLDLSDLSGAPGREPQALADAILRDWALGDDDAAVLVYGIALGEQR